MKFEVVDRCPVPSGLAPDLLEAKRRSGQTLNSCFRGAEAREILRRYGKMDQATLYEGWLHHLPGFNPANPPGFSTHECFNDGVAFPQYRRGARIPEELCGQDWSNAWAVVNAYRQMGLMAALTYPSSVLERQHVNIREVPQRYHMLRKGMVAHEVGVFTHKLFHLVSPKSRKRYLTEWGNRFGPVVEGAVKAFQRDYGLSPDGVVGPHTEHQLDVAFAHWRTSNPVVVPPPRRPHGHKPPPVHKPTPRIPARGLVTTIDISGNNGSVDWPTIHRQGHLGAFSKVSEGVDWADPMWSRERWLECTGTGMLFGGYHFARFRHRNGMTLIQGAQHEADYFIHRLMSACPGGRLKFGRDLRPVLDFEWSEPGIPTDEVQACIDAFCHRVNDRIGHKPTIYAGGYWKDLGLHGNPLHCPLWRAEYGPYCEVLRPWRDWDLWQFTGYGHVAGVRGSCDISRTSAQKFRNLLIPA